MTWMCGILIAFLALFGDVSAGTTPMKEKVTKGTQEATTPLTTPREDDYGDDFMQKPLPQEHTMPIEGTEEDDEYDDEDVDDEATEESQEEE